MSCAQVDYTMRTLAAKHLGAVRSELAAADVPGRLMLLSWWLRLALLSAHGQEGGYAC